MSERDGFTIDNSNGLYVCKGIACISGKFQRMGAVNMNKHWRKYQTGKETRSVQCSFVRLTREAKCTCMHEFTETCWGRSFPSGALFPFAKQDPLLIRHDRAEFYLYLPLKPTRNTTAPQHSFTVSTAQKVRPGSRDAQTRSVTPVPTYKRTHVA